MLPARPLRIGALAFLLGGEGHGLLGPEESTADGAGVAVGVRVGYVGAVGQRPWSSEVGRVAGGPDLSPSGLFLRFQVGGGARP